MSTYARIALAITAAMTIACHAPGSDGSGGGGTITGNALQGRVLAQAMTGTAESEIAGVRVSAAGQVTTTDSYGFWSLPVPKETAQGLTIDYFRSGYAPYTYHYPLAITASAFVQVSLMPVQIMQTVTVSEGAVISSNLGEETMQLAIILPPDFIDVDGETVDVAVAIVRPDKEEEYKRFPGDFIGVDPAMAEGSDLLRTFGTVNLSFSQNGVPIDEVRLNAPAVMQMRLDERSAQEMAVGATIETWWLDADSAKWMREGAATVVEINESKYAEWEVEHFTWWNVDYPLDLHGCIAVEFSDRATLPAELLAKTTIELKGHDYSGWSQPQSIRQDGLFVLTGWRDHEVDLSIQFPGTPQSGFSLAFVPQDASEGNLANGTFRVPGTMGSGYWNIGPNREVLDPKKHCKVITREYGIHQGVVEGFVYGPDGKGVAGVTVFIPEIGFSTKTNPAGHYTFEHIPWSKDFEMRLTVSGHATTRYIVNSKSVVRDAAHHRIDLDATAFALPVRLTDVQFSATEAPVGSSITFRVNAQDGEGDLLWSIESDYGTISYDTTQTTAGDTLMAYNSTLRATWLGPAESADAQIRLTAYDVQGNMAQYVTQIQWLNRDPVVQLTGPAYLDRFEAATYSAQALDPENQPLKYRWYINGSLQDVSSPELDHYFTAENVYQIRVEVNDGETDVTRDLITVVSDPVIVDNTDTVAPQTTIHSGYSGPTSDTSATFTFASPDTDTQLFQCYIDAPPYATCTTPHNLTGLAEGNHIFVVRAVDQAGNPDPTPAMRSWSVDTVAPQITYVSVPPASTTSDSATLSWTCSEANCTYACSLTSAAGALPETPYTACTSSKTYTGLATGTYTARIVATDNAGNYSSPVSAAWSVTTTVDAGTTWSSIPGGCFDMGDALDSVAEELPVHNVCLTAFEMNHHEVTNGEYKSCVTAGSCTPPGNTGSTSGRTPYYGNIVYANYPVVYVNWSQAQSYCAWVGGRLPTEAEWEYAAHGGTYGKRFPWGDTISCAEAVYYSSQNYMYDVEPYVGNKWCGNPGGDTNAVGSYAANGYGLFDMAGNVWEWVGDWYGSYTTDAVNDPTGPASGTNRVIRSGSFSSYAENERVSYRSFVSPTLQYSSQGFRCVR